MPKRFDRAADTAAAAICTRIASARSLRAAVVSLDGVLAQNVAHADAQQLLVLEAVQDRVEVVGAAAQLGQLLAQLVPRRAAG